MVPLSPEAHQCATTDHRWECYISDVNTGTKVALRRPILRQEVMCRGQGYTALCGLSIGPWDDTSMLRHWEWRDCEFTGSLAGGREETATAGAAP